jgi:type-F conjugative transfer system protein TraW
MTLIVVSKTERILFLLQEVKRELKRIHIDGCRYNERLNAKTEGSKLLAYTGLCSKTYSGHTDLGTNTVCLYPAEYNKLSIEEKKKKMLCPVSCDFQKCIYKCFNSQLNNLYYDNQNNNYLNINPKDIDYLTFTSSLKKNEINNVKEKIFQQVNNPQSTKNLPKTLINRSWKYDPSVSLPHDLKDQNGKIFYKAHTKINPLEKIILTKSLIFINGLDQEQVKWALDKYQQRKGRVKIILTTGKIIDLMKAKKIRFYFDQNNFLIEKFDIKALPAIVEQEDKALKITEVAI